MRSFIALSLAGSTLAVPFVDVLSNIKNFARHDSVHHHYPPMGSDCPFPTGTSPSGPLPTESGGMNSLPFSETPQPGPPVVSRVLQIDYSLGSHKRQAYGTGIVPVLPPSGTNPAFPSGTGFPFPNGGSPTGVPSGGFPTGGFPIPTTLATFTRGPPVPTGIPYYPDSPDSPDSPDDGAESGWLQDWVDTWKQLLGDHRDE